MISDIKDKMSKFKGGDPARLVFKSDRQKSSLRYAFDSQGQYNDFVRQVNAQNELLKTYKKVRGGSETQERSMLTEDAGMARDLLQGNMLGAAMNVARRGASQSGGISPEVSANLQKMLFTPSSKTQSEILKLMNQNKPKTGAMYQPATYGGLLGELQALMTGQ